jgi:putative ABC transport system substrate-binding protein
MPVIGLLGAASAQAYAAQVAAVRQGLDDLVSKRVAVIVTAGGTATALATKAATNTIPIVFALGGDPVRSGLVASLNRPGGNVTGVAAFSELLNQKRLQVARELTPEAVIVAFLHNPNNPNFASEMTKVEEAARAIGRQVRILTAGRAQQFEGVFVT